MKLRLFLFLAVSFILFACGVPPENTSMPANRETLPIGQSTTTSTQLDSTMPTARQRQPAVPLTAPSGPQPPIFTFSDSPILNKPVVVTVRFPPGIYPLSNMDISVSVPDGFEVVETPEGVKLDSNAWVWKDGVYGVGRALVWEKDKEFKRDVPFEIKATIIAVKTGDFWMEARAAGPPQGVSVYVSSQIMYISVFKNGAEVSTRPPVRSAVPSRNEPPARGPAPGDPLPGRGTSITGRVYEADGKTPVADELVWYLQPSQIVDAKVISVTTDASGSYRISNVITHGGLARIRTGGKKYVLSEVKEVPVESGKGKWDWEIPNINFNLVLGGSVTGHVYREDGRTPIPNARVVWQQWEGEKTPLVSVYDRIYSPQSVQTNADGSYVMGGLLTGGYRLHAVADGYAESYYNKGDYQGDVRLVSVLQGKETPKIDFTLLPLGSISGHVYQSDGKTPIQGAEVNVPGKNPGRTQTNEEGAYIVKNLYAGRVTVMASTTGYLWNQQGAMVDWGKNTANVDLNLSRGGTISGYVYEEDGDTPIANASVLCIGGGTSLAERTKPDGSYSFSGLPTGAYYLRATALGYAGDSYYGGDFPGKAVQIDGAAGQVLTNINLRLNRYGSISGRVYYADGKTPVEGAWAEAIPLKENHGPAERTNTAGSYVIRNVMGEYRIKFTYFYGDQKIIQYYPNTNDSAMAKVVAVYGGKDTAYIDLVMAIDPPPSRK